MAVGQDTECGERSKTSYVRPADEEDFTVIGEVNSFNHFQASKQEDETDQDQGLFQRLVVLHTRV